jgi:uncharacterized protein (UPF0548 family)
MLVLGHPSAATLDALLGEANKEELSYPERGATLGGDLPSGYRHDRHDLRLGGPEAFDRAVTGLRRWVPHEGADIHVFPPGQPLLEGATFLAHLAFGPAEIVAPCRVVSVVEEADRFGFVYGTLPGHPERGEEAFVVERRNEGTFFVITAFSRPAGALPWVVAPVGRAMQLAITRRCLGALTRFVRCAGN